MSETKNDKFVANCKIVLFLCTKAIIILNNYCTITIQYIHYEVKDIEIIEYDSY